ncbi:Haloacid dehalogenase-like hydrolase [hydrothermal vent metagenome]|uniref:Haloacid dehalogenase-like hydrolase n=1 Tax=hydrothermal vent metagenome TaxID=652676 RepID=A0A3B0RBE3_9ZZZZ
MKPFAECSSKTLANVSFLVSDIDDTLTLDGVLPAQVYASLEAMRKIGIRVILITGRPAGWCDMIARFWPIDAVVGENGSFYFKPQNGQIKRVWMDDAPTRQANLHRLQHMADSIVGEFAGTALAEDNPWRATDIAVDFAEDVPPLSLRIAGQIRDRFAALGATAKVSSIHVNAWIGSYDKLSMFEKLLADEYVLTVDDVVQQTLYTGDSPNDAPMFRRFFLSVGMHSVRQYNMPAADLPGFVTEENGADGFMQVARRIFASRKKPV